jgi:hypothetical protein
MIEALITWISTNILGMLICSLILGFALSDWFSLDFSKLPPSIRVIAGTHIRFPSEFLAYFTLNLLVGVDSVLHLLPSSLGPTFHVWGLVIANIVVLIAVTLHHFSSVRATMLGRKE